MSLLVPQMAGRIGGNDCHIIESGAKARNLHHLFPELACVLVASSSCRSIILFSVHHLLTFQLLSLGHNTQRHLTPIHTQAHRLNMVSASPHPVQQTENLTPLRCSPCESSRRPRPPHPHPTTSPTNPPPTRSTQSTIPSATV